MEIIGSLIERLQRWFARYRAELVYPEARDRRRPIAEMEWNGAMIGDLRRRRSTLSAHGKPQAQILPKHAWGVQCEVSLS
jgi:hypothetical protein